ncbi:MAG: hypothetical protein ACM3VZ_10525 [Acidobacteriota bacterium]
MSELSGRFDGWLSFQDRLAAGMAMAAAQPADLYFCDVDFSHWPLGAPAILDAFHQWVMSSTAPRCHLLAVNFDEMPRRHPRWLAWRQNWGHRVQCKLIPEDAAPGLLPTFVLKDCLALRIMDQRSGAGIWSRDPGTMRAWVSEFDVISQRSHEALPATTLGL